MRYFDNRVIEGFADRKRNGEEVVKEELINYLNNQTDFIDLTNISELFTAKKLAEIFKVKRNTVSHYLNQLTNEGKLVKINSRPVYYFHKGAFERHYYL